MLTDAQTPFLGTPLVSLKIQFTGPDTGTGTGAVAGTGAGTATGGTM